MREISLKAWAKINLTLDVKHKNPDGYHEVEMVMQTISLCDLVCLREMDGGGIFAKSNRYYVPGDERNTAVMAAHAFFKKTGILPPSGLAIHLKKEIPVAAGLAGGSADAAAVLRGLNRMYEARLSLEELMEIGQTVGSDVPFCLMGGTAFAFGRGERLRPLPPAPDFHVVVCKPLFSLSTAKMYAQLDWTKIDSRPDSAEMCRALERGQRDAVAAQVKNVMEQALGPRRGEVERIKQTLLENGAQAASMSGSGPAVFGLFSEERTAKNAAEQLKKYYRDVYLCDMQHKLD